MKVMTCGEAMMKLLSAYEVDTVFGMAGTMTLELYRGIAMAGVRHVQCRNEQGASLMADGYARATGKPGVCTIIAGPGVTNAATGIAQAYCDSQPMLVLSGACATRTQGKGWGAIHELADQAAVTAGFTASSHMVRYPEELPELIARAYAVFRGSRPRPVHLSLPSDLLEGDADAALPAKEDFLPEPGSPGMSEEMLDRLKKAKKPLVIAGPALGNARGRAALRGFEEATGVPSIVMESPRGVNDPSLGLLAEVLAAADVVVLAGKRKDFTLKFGAAFGKDCRVIETDGWIAPDAGKGWAKSSWLDEVRAAIVFRPAQWKGLASNTAGPLHPVEVGREVQKLLAAKDAVLVVDGGEFGQWAQATVTAPRRIINGVAGSIGSALPFAAAAKLALPGSTVVVMLGDGTFGFHASEIDTAVRFDLPYVAVVGNDSCWNAEYQIQLRSYGAARAHGLDLLPTRYDRVAAAFGAHGEHVERPAELAPALERAAGAGRMACVNVMIERLPAPTFRRG